MTAPHQIVVVGAGPAGIRAAETIVEAGLRPVVIDEGASWGGQIYRQPPPNSGFQRSKKDLYGFEAKKAHSVHTAMANLLGKVDYQAETLVWSCAPGQLDTFHRGTEKRVGFSHIVVASGATDRVLPVQGWTLPGVFTLGGAQVALKSQGCAIGSRVVFAGTGPLLYLVAYQYAKAGAQVIAVLDTSPFMNQVKATAALLNQPATLAKGLYYVAWLQARGIRIERNVSLSEIRGNEAVSGVSWKNSSRGANAFKHIDCDAVGLSFGLRSETQLADLLGCQFEFDLLNRCWLPVRDPAGRSSVKGVYLAGDGAGIAGADAAELSGKRAALALVEDLGVQLSPDHVREIVSIERRIAKVIKFREGIESAFPVPHHIAEAWPDDLTICRCEEVKVGTLRRCIRNGEASELNRLKALTRVGMGRCQGRMCGEAASVLLAKESNRALCDVGRLRSQTPIKPVAIPLSLGSDHINLTLEGHDE